MWRPAVLSSWAFAKIDAIVTLVILFVFGIMSLIKERYESIVCTACISYLRYIDT